MRDRDGTPITPDGIRPGAKLTGADLTRRTVTALLILILAVFTVPQCAEARAEGRCTNDGGRILVLSGRRLCDFPPNAAAISDMIGRDYWIDP